MTERDQLIKELEVQLDYRSSNYVVIDNSGFAKPRYDEDTTLLMRAVLLLLKEP